MATKVIVVGPQISKEQSNRLSDVADRLSKRAKDPEDYQATVQDVVEVDRLIKALDQAVDKITKK